MRRDANARRGLTDSGQHGTLNIHPSLLPAWRGAAPVQRAVEAGAEETGVSVAYTVLEMDAGPVLAAERAPVPPDATSAELLDTLFARGADLLLDALPDALSGAAAARATPQDPAGATQAPKLSQAEAELDFDLPAQQVHNKVRAFEGWPGTRATFQLEDPAGNGPAEPVVIKVVETRVSREALGHDFQDRRVQLTKAGQLLVACGGGTVLEVLRLQPPTKKAMDPRSYYNGLRGKCLAL